MNSTGAPDHHKKRRDTLQGPQTDKKPSSELQNLDEEA